MACSAGHGRSATWNARSGWVELSKKPMPQHNHQTTCKSRRQYLYHDPTRISCSKCKATFQSHLTLKRHQAQLRACQSSSEDEEQSHLQPAADVTHLEQQVTLLHLFKAS
jgi:hypothetical protein